MPTLRQKMTEDMQLRNLSPQTQTSYLLQVTQFTRYFGVPPETGVSTFSSQTVLDLRAPLAIALPATKKSVYI